MFGCSPAMTSTRSSVRPCGTFTSAAAQQRGPNVSAPLPKYCVRPFCPDSVGKDSTLSSKPTLPCTTPSPKPQKTKSRRDRLASTFTSAYGPSTEKFAVPRPAHGSWAMEPKSDSSRSPWPRTSSPRVES